MFQRRSVIALATVLAAVMVAGCSSSAATFPNANGSNGGNGAGASPTVNPNDPQSIITHVIGGATNLANGDQTIKSFHLKVALNGTLKAAGLSSLGGSSLGAMFTSDVKLDGTALEGDVDVIGKAAHLGLTVAPIAALGTTPITADIIYVGAAAYVKTSLTGALYTNYNVGDLTSSLPISVPTAGPSTLTNVEDQVAAFRKQMDDAGAKTTLVGVEKIGGKDAYHINVTVPVSTLNDKISAASSPNPAMLTLDSASLDVWAYKDTYNLAQVELKGSSATLGNLDLVITITNYNGTVTITAPPASEVQTPAV